MRAGRSSDTEDRNVMATIAKEVKSSCDRNERENVDSIMSGRPEHRWSRRKEHWQLETDSTSNESFGEFRSVMRREGI
jgi:hypothetical protein